MNTLIYLSGAVVLLVLLYLLARYIGGTYFKFRGERVITCPENQQPAAVEVNARRAALSAASGSTELRLSECSRWPDKSDCGQECLRQIEASPQDCLVQNIFRKWYLEKPCAVCGKTLGRADWMERQPAVMDPQRITLELRNIPSQDLPGVLLTHQPVCWNCHIAESFRRKHPELVVDRGWDKDRNTLIH